MVPIVKTKIVFDSLFSNTNHMTSVTNSKWFGYSFALGKIPDQTSKAFCGYHSFMRVRKGQNPSQTNF